MLRIRRYGGHQNTKKRIYGGQSGNQPALYTSTKGQTIASQFARVSTAKKPCLTWPMNWKTCDPRQIAEWRCPRTQYERQRSNPY